MPEQKPQRKQRVERLSSEYHKAHKQVMLWAGILFIWELVGIDLTKAENAEGNVGAIVKSIKSPQAVPWVLLVLVGYFLFKTSIEWGQCDVERRTARAAKVDYISAWIVSILAYALYAYQAISKIQLADVLQGSNRFQSVIVGFTVGFVLTIDAYLLLEIYFDRTIHKLRLILTGVGTLIAILTFILFRSIFNWYYLSIGVVIGITLILVLMVYFRPWLFWRTNRDT